METDDFFNCDVCGKCAPQFLELSRTLQCVVFENSIAEGYHIADSWDILGLFCSEACVDKAHDEVMADEQVALPSVPLNAGPIESCAVCHGPVHMNEWHTAYTKRTAEILDDVSAQQVGYVTLAVVCPGCRPLDASATCRGISIVDSAEIRAALMED